MIPNKWADPRLFRKNNLEVNTLSNFNISVGGNGWGFAYVHGDEEFSHPGSYNLLCIFLS